MTDTKPESYVAFENEWNRATYVSGSPVLIFKEQAYELWQAATACAMSCKVKLPERKDTTTMQDGKSRQMREAFNSCLDQITLEPVDIEKLLPSDDISKTKLIELQSSWEEEKLPSDLVSACSSIFISGWNFFRQEVRRFNNMDEGDKE